MWKVLYVRQFRSEPKYVKSIQYHWQEAKKKIMYGTHVKINFHSDKVSSISTSSNTSGSYPQ